MSVSKPVTDDRLRRGDCRRSADWGVRVAPRGCDAQHVT